MCNCFRNTSKIFNNEVILQLSYNFILEGQHLSRERTCPRGLCRFDLSKGQVNQQKCYVLPLQRGANFVLGAWILIGGILNEFFLICTSGEKHQVNHLSRGMEWVVIFPEGAKHQVNHMSQDIDLVLIYCRGAKHKVKHLPRWVEWF